MSGSGTKSPGQQSLSSTVPQTGTIAPFNSVSTTQTAMGGIPNTGGSLSHQALSDKLNQVALYSLISDPPSVKGMQGTEEFFEDLDEDGEGVIPWRAIASILTPQDIQYTSRFPMDQMIGITELVQFIEEASKQQKDLRRK